jgi:hypothetical protein
MRWAEQNGIVNTQKNAWLFPNQRLIGHGARNWSRWQPNGANLRNGNARLPVGATDRTRQRALRRMESEEWPRIEPPLPRQRNLIERMFRLHAEGERPVVGELAALAAAGGGCGWTTVS